MPRRLASDSQLTLFDELPPLVRTVSPPDAFTPTTDSCHVPPPAPSAADAHLVQVATGHSPWRHPDADQRVVLEGQWVGYRLRRARRRSIGFVVGAEGLTVNAPTWLSLAEIEAALAAKARWIVRKLDEQRERQRRVEASRVDWRDGASIPYLGEPLVIVLDPRQRGVRLDAAGTAGQAPLAGIASRSLRVGLANDAGAEAIRLAVQRWLQREARRVFAERCQHFAPRLDVRWTRIALSSARTRWGSASAGGAIRLNWRLIHFGIGTIDYVVAHELAHLREMNHSPRFWAVVRSVLPDYENARRQLKSDLLPPLD